jgi:hypothetical protein
MDALARYVELPEAILVHGFYEPGRALADQQETVVVGTLTGEQYLLDRYPRPWYELYDGDKPLIVGHRDYRTNGEPLIYNERVYGIDTGCCHGGRLTGLLLPEFRVVSVASRRDYWTQLQKQHADLRYATTPDERLTWEAAESIATSAELARNASGAMTERAQRVAAMLCQGEQAVRTLYEVLRQYHEEIVKQIRIKVDPETTTPKEFGQLYAAKVRESPLARYLHRLRLGTLQVESLKHSFRGPAEAMAFAQRAVRLAAIPEHRSGDDS